MLKTACLVLCTSGICFGAPYATINKIDTDGSRIYVEYSVGGGKISSPPKKVGFPLDASADDIRSFIQNDLNQAPQINPSLKELEGIRIDQNG